MAKSLSREIGELNMGVDLWLKRSEEMFIQGFRDLVWEIFLRILRETPQDTGKAVANWNIGVGAPDYNFSDHYGDLGTIVQDPGVGAMSQGGGAMHRVPAHKKGDPEWISVAKQRNSPKLAMIKRNTRVYINNAVRGDNDSGRTASTLYLEELQNPDYWARKLREVNKPYETAQESLIIMFERESRLRGMGFKPGGTNFQHYQDVP